MADHSPIEWTDATWNPIVGCSVTSPGCTNCYAMSMARRIEAMQPGSHYAGTTKVVNGRPVWTGKVALAPDHILTQPARWHRPRKIFVNSMGDLFHEDVPDDWIDRVFAVMALCPRHTFQVLTKRSARMRQYIESRTIPDEHGQPAEAIRVQLSAWVKTPSWSTRYPTDVAITTRRPSCVAIPWPLPNVWLGVSAEDQRRADERVPDLLSTPAAIRFVSAEPLLGPLDLRRFMWPVLGWWRGPHHSYAEAKAAGAECGLKRQALVGAWCTFLDLVIAGGENGPRPMHPDWARSLRDQCAAAGVPFFFKQWGSFEPAVDRERDDPDWRLDYTRRFGDSGNTRWINLEGGRGFHGEHFHVMRRVGKRAAGRLLDGVEHNGMPEART